MVLAHCAVPHGLASVQIDIACRISVRTAHPESPMMGVSISDALAADVHS